MKKDRDLRCTACGKIVKVGRYQGGSPDYWCGKCRLVPSYENAK